MKKSTLKLLAALVLTSSMALSARADLSDFMDRKEIQTRIRKEIANLDINASVGLGDIDLIEGVNVAAKYRYDVEASYQDQYYTRVDKWDLNTAIKAGDILKNVVDLPFAFDVNRNSSFIFVRQFKEKKSALKALPYTPLKLPLSADLALKNLATGDFVSIPASMNIAVSAQTSTATAVPVVVSATAKIYYIMSGEFTIQVFKIDDSHVRLKLISVRGYNAGVDLGSEVSFKMFGVSLVDKQIDRLFDRDLLKLGYVINPGAQFIVDYVFDLKDADAKDAYDQILRSTLKLRDAVVMDRLSAASELKDKLISSYEKAEKVFEQDRLKDPKDRRVSRIFKGFNDYTGHTKKMKMALLVARFNKENALTDNKVTYIDKNESNLEFYYPTFSKYMEARLGKWIFELKDQSYQTNFALIPRLDAENTKEKNPDFGLTFERRDKYFAPYEQRYVQKFLVDQIPSEIAKQIDITEWKDGKSKTDSRIFLQVVLKKQGFDYLKNYSQEELEQKLLDYVEEKNKIQVFDDKTVYEKLKNFLFINRFIEKERLQKLAEELYTILKNEENDSELMTRRLVKLNEYGIFDKIGVGFLISLLPQNQLKDLIYLKLEMTALKLKAVKLEYGFLNYSALYKELTEVQSRIANRSYDLRVTDHDHEMENEDHGGSPNLVMGLH